MWDSVSCTRGRWTIGFCVSTCWGLSRLCNSLITRWLSACSQRSRYGDAESHLLYLLAVHTSAAWCRWSSCHCFDIAQPLTAHPSALQAPQNLALSTAPRLSCISSQALTNCVITSLPSLSCLHTCIPSSKVYFRCTSWHASGAQETACETLVGVTGLQADGRLCCL